MVTLCRDTRMANGVFKMFMAIAINESNLSHIEPVQFFDKMKQEKRFHADLWNMQLNFKQVIEQVQKDNYSKAEKWLGRVKQPA